MAKIQIVQGERGASKNALADVRGGPYSEMIVNDTGLGRYFEATRLGRAFILTGASAGVAPGAANVSPLSAGTGQPLVGIFNPAGSVKAAVILGAGYVATNVVTTQTASMLVWNYIPTPTGITAAGGAGSVRADLPSAASSSVMKTFVNSALTGSVAGILLRPLQCNSQMSTNPAVAQAVASNGYEETAGGIIVPPGAFLGLAAHAASATLYTCTMTWAEIDWPL
jgi:hypothetical protein